MENGGRPVKAVAAVKVRAYPVCMADDRERRLGEALRANLRRRKAQARAGDEPATTPAPLPADREDTV